MNICTKYGFDIFIISGSYGGHRRHTTYDGQRTMPRVHVWPKLPTGELKRSLNSEHLTLNTFKKVKQIQELISEEVTELLLLLSLLLLFLLLLMSILLLLSSLLERISFHFVNVHVWRRRFSKVCIKFSMFKFSLAIISPIM